MQSVSTHTRTGSSPSPSFCADSLTTAACGASTVRSAPQARTHRLENGSVPRPYIQESAVSTSRFVKTEPGVGLPSGLGIAIASFAMILGVALLKSPSWKHLREYFYSMRRSRQIPCSRCRFHHHNPYMRCAVHPTKAQTSQAINCSDYWGYDHDEFRC